MFRKVDPKNNPIKKLNVVSANAMIPNTNPATHARGGQRSISPLRCTKKDMPSLYTTPPNLTHLNG